MSQLEQTWPSGLSLGPQRVGRDRSLKPRRRQPVAGALAVFLLFPIFLFVSARCYATAHIGVSAPRPGRVFFAGEPVRLALTAPEKCTVTCKVYDYWNRLVAVRRLVIPSGRPKELYLGRRPAGWYRVRLYQGNQFVREDAFCVLRQIVDHGAHSRLFGVCAVLENQDMADFLSFAGVRHVRRDWGWPVIEPADGLWTAQYIQPYMQRAAKAGLEFLPIVGYSPGFARVRPADATEGRPSQAQHTWPIKDKRQWVEFLRWCKSFAASMPDVTWPPERLDARPTRRNRYKAVRGWEVWNEADQNFYYGPWHQYCDLLRLAYAVLDDQNEPVMYGGSCGHWTEMGMALRWDMRPFFDVAAAHPGGEADAAMPGWFYGAQSIAYKCGAPYRLSFTESYFRDPSAGATYPEYVLPMVAKLRHWDIQEHYKMLLWSRTQGMDLGSEEYAYRMPDGLAPTPAYVATAFARWLLADAAYAGRLSLANGVEAFAFVRYGRPLLVVRSVGAPRRVSIAVQRGARLMDFLGRTVWTARGNRAAFTVGRAPRVVIGCQWKYVAAAARKRMEEYMSTHFGARPVDGRWTGYVDTLGKDAGRMAPDKLAAAKAAVAEAIDELSSKGPAGALISVRQAAGRLRHSLLALAPKTSAEAVEPRRMDTIWRMCNVVEWFCELSDAVQKAAGRRYSFSTIAAHTRRQIDIAWAAAVDRGAGTDRFRARSLARRAAATADRAERLRGPMLSFAARVEARVAQVIAAREPPVLTRVVAVAEFPDAQFLVKGELMEPGCTHTVRLIVSNQTPRKVDVTLHVRFPGGWEPGQVTRAASVRPYSTTTAATIAVTVPGGDQWETKNSWRPWSGLTLLCPVEVPANQQVELWATVGGLQTPHSFYYFNVGKLLKTPQAPL